MNEAWLWTAKPIDIQSKTALRLSRPADERRWTCSENLARSLGTDSKRFARSSAVGRGSPHNKKEAISSYV